MKRFHAGVFSIVKNNVGGTTMSLSKYSVILYLAMISLISAQETTSEPYDQLKKKIAKCASIEGVLSRMECYDQLAKSLSVDKPAIEISDTPDKGSWQVQVETNPIDDSKTYIFYLPAESGESTYGKPVVMILRYKSGETNIFVNWQSYLGSEADVLMRVGKEKAKTDRWSMSTDSKATFLPAKYNPVEFIGRLKTVETLVLQVTPYGDSPITAVFNIIGFEEAIAPHVEELGWD